jgi:hypothetical protein
MKAMDIIQQIEALPAQEMREIFDYVHQKEAKHQEVVSYADETQAAEVIERVMKNNKTILQKLAK